MPVLPAPIPHLYLSLSLCWAHQVASTSPASGALMHDFMQSVIQLYPRRFPRARLWRSVPSISVRLVPLSLSLSIARVHLYILVAPYGRLMSPIESTGRSRGAVRPSPVLRSKSHFPHDTHLCCPRQPMGCLRFHRPLERRRASCSDCTSAIVAHIRCPAHLA